LQTPLQGIVVYRASRLEALLAPLDALLHAWPPAHTLAPHTVVAAHPGMRHWLLGELARFRGPGDVVANVDVVLPSRWLDALAQQVLGVESVAVAPYRRAQLRWRIHALLAELDDLRLSDYLRGADAPRRRFQLADRLAHIFSQYLVYRPDWLDAWQRDPAAAPSEPLLGPLWHRLRADIGQAHRGERMRALVSALTAGAVSIETTPLHVFGISHLAPTELAVLRALSRLRPVVFYLPDPCREFWGGLVDPRRALREQAELEPFGSDAESWYFDQTRQHPLLARWGRLGQHFAMALHDDAQGIDERHWQDLPEADQVPGNRLQRLQESIRRLDPALMAVDATTEPGQKVECEDASLRVHACHTRLRELEVLRDQLLCALEDDPTLSPADIVVMAPDIRAYVPLLPAVFGPPGVLDGRAGPLPYHLADVPLTLSHPVFGAFERLMALPQSRLSAPELIDLIGEPAVARRFRFAAEDPALIAHWLAEGRVAWALDAAHRQRRGVPALTEHTLAWGMDRLIGGYLFGALGEDESGAVALPDGTALAPLAGAGGSRAELLGRLDRLLRTLDAFLAFAAEPHSASEWAERLAERVDELFEIDRTDSAAVDALVQLKRLIAELASEPIACGLDPVLDYSVVREVLSEKLAAVPERQRFLMGGVTVCGMVPQRSIPFRMVAVLGLNDGEFPRSGGDSGLDAMTRLRRIGDRDTRTDDRYLFLETVMSARQRLHLSFVGKGVRDGKARNPAPPLAELLAALDQAAGIRADAGAGEQPRPWRVDHPLQPFDRRYFSDSGDARLFSYAHDNLALIDGQGAPHRAFFDPTTADDAASTAAPAHDAQVPVDVALRALLNYFRDPSRQVLRDRLGLTLDALEDDRLSDSEPLEARFEAIDRIGRRLFLDAAQHGGLALPEEPPDWLRLTGLLPPGRPGQQAWLQERDKVAALIAAAQGHSLFTGAVLPPRGAIKLVLPLGRWRLAGESNRVHRGDDADWVFDVFVRKSASGTGRHTERELGFRERIPAFIEWAALRLSQARTRAVRLCLLTESLDAPWQVSINDWDARYGAADPAQAESLRAELAERLDRLIAFWHGAQSRPPWYFPKTSWCAATGDAGKVSATFIGNGERSIGERDYAPGYAALLAGDLDFAEGSAARAQLDATAIRLHQLIQLDEASAP